MSKAFVFIMCLSVCLSFVTCELNKEEGADCEFDGIKGKCVPARRCLNSLDERSDKQPVCSHKGEETIICCTDCELVNDTSNFIMSPSSGTFWKDGRKSRDACLQYLKDLPHKCHQEGYYTGLRRELNKEKKCHIYSTWGIGGAPAFRAREPTEHPYQAITGFAVNETTTIWFYPAAIIHEKFVLTSAHQTISPTGNYPLKFVAVGLRTPNEKKIYNIKKVYVHPEYNSGPGKKNDIAVIELETPITFDRDILPACLPEPTEEFDTSKATFTSRLRNDSNPDIHIPLDSPHVVELKEYTPEECYAKMKEQQLKLPVEYQTDLPPVDGDSQACYGVDKCRYIVGVPVSVRTQYSRCMNTLVGLNAYGTSSCAPTVFTKVKHFTPWIESIVWP